MKPNKHRVSHDLDVQQKKVPHFTIFFDPFPFSQMSFYDDPVQAVHDELERLEQAITLTLQEIGKLSLTHHD